MVQRRYGRSFREEWVAEEDGVISCALFSRDVALRYPSGKEESGVDGPTTPKLGMFLLWRTRAVNPQILDDS